MSKIIVLFTVCRWLISFSPKKREDKKNSAFARKESKSAVE